MLDDIQTTAKVLYQLSIDMDYGDYAESLDDILDDLENALYHLKAICQNSCDSDYHMTFARCLDLITENTELNENFFRFE